MHNIFGILCYNWIKTYKWKGLNIIVGGDIVLTENLFETQEDTPVFKKGQFATIVERFGLTQVEKSLKYKQWAILNLLFEFKVPPQLEEILNTLYCSEQIDHHYTSDLDKMVNIKTLYLGFIEKYSRLPHIFPSLVILIEELNVKLVIEEFSIKGMRYAITIHEVEEETNRVLYGVIFKDKVFDVVDKLRKSSQDLTSFIQGFPLSFPFIKKDLEKWIIKHAGRSNIRMVHDVAAFWDQEDFPKDGTLAEMKIYIEKNRKEKEWELCKEKYPDAFASPFRFNIIKVSVKNNIYSVRYLEPDDKLQVLLGSLTVCCQRLNSSGEASMMEGLLNPDSGFLVFERSEKLLAQSWVWLSEDKNTLVMDNIELSDNRNPSEIIPLLRWWIRLNPYKNIQLGINYSRIKDGILVEDKDMCWFKQHWHHFYSDAYKRVWLKRDGLVLINDQNYK